MDPLRYRSVTDFLVRSLGVGIFVVENYNHLLYFDTEASRLIQPAIRPIPGSLAKLVHAITITLGLSGSLSVWLWLTWLHAFSFVVHCSGFPAGQPTTIARVAYASLCLHGHNYMDLVVQTRRRLYLASVRYCRSPEPHHSLFEEHVHTRTPPHASERCIVAQT